MLIQARKVYTNKTFEDFQDQFEDAVNLSVLGPAIDEGVTFHEMFERLGILCTHVLKVLRDYLDIKELILGQRILKKWIKQFRVECV